MSEPVHNPTARPEEAACDRIWGARAKAYARDVGATLASRLKLDLVRKYMTPESRVCDVGCGNGLFLRVLAPHCAQVTGVDLNAEMLAEARAMIAREGIGNAELTQGSAAALPFPDASFDLVFCFSTLLLVPDVDAALRHMARILRAGGYLILDIAGRNNLSRIYWNRWYRREGHFGVHAFAYPAVRRKLESLGCKIVERHALGFCDQWKYVPGVHRFAWLDRIFHPTPDPARNLDYWISNLPGVFRFANRWYVIARKGSGR